MIKYKYKYTNTNTNTHTQIQIRTHKYKYKYRGVKFWHLSKIKSFHKKGHISGTVRPTSLQHHSNRSSLPARPEKHLRWSLTCPGNTGEPEAPVSEGAQAHRNRLSLGPEPKKWLRQKSELFWSFWPDSTIFPSWAIKKLRRDTLGKSLGGSVAENRPRPYGNP